MLYTPFSLNDRAVAGLRLSQAGSASKALVVNSPTQQAAYGLRFYGSQGHHPLAGEEGWSTMASHMTAWTIAAPQHHGFFPITYDVERSVWPQLVTPTAYNVVPGYEIAACAATGSWLLRWYTDLTDDGALLHYARRLGNGLLSIQRADGTFPSNIDLNVASNMEQPVSPTLEVVTLFLAQLAQATGDGGYTRALVRACATLMSLTAATTLDHNLDHCSAGIALLKSYRLTGDKAHLQTGLQLADELSRRNAPTTDLNSTASSAELYAESYRLTMQPSYAALAMQSLRRHLLTPHLPLDAGWPAFKSLSIWAILEANYPDVLLSVP